MKHLNRIFLFLMVLLMVFAATATVSANSAEPPGMIVIVLGAPEDVELALEFPGSEDSATRTRRAVVAWEDHFRFYYHTNNETFEKAVIRVTAGDNGFTCPLPEGVTNQYNNLLTLDYGARTLRAGQPPWRQPLYIAMRVALTLLIEGVVFYLFGFRKPWSWAVFLAINLATQLWLNIFLADKAFSNGYWFFAYIGIEILIFLGECVAFPVATNETPKWKCVLYALSANTASLLLGSWLISNLPV